tara:strand:+ start:3764 stop:4381 length:618 start_codon:yes stop_codon:yes gene_type:complete
MPKQFVYFGSGTQLKWLSNFAVVEDPRGLKFGKRRYRTSEHAYQSLKVAEEHRDRLAVGGDLEGLQALKAIYPDPAVAAKKIKYWTAQSDPVLAGISAKMITKEKHARKLKRPLKLETLRDPPLNELKGVWREILTAKLKASPSFRKALKCTGDVRLIEFNRGAKRESDAGRPPFWTGLMKDEKLYGKNYMGKMLMEIRKGMYTV